MSDETPTPVEGLPVAWPGRHFSLEEFACHDGSPYPLRWIPLRLVPLVGALDAIRDAWGAPLTVVSGYRTSAHNTAVGGASASQHVEGRAADVAPLEGPEPFPDRVARFHGMILGMWNAGELPDLGALGYYPGRWCHVDVRERQPIGHLAQWVGTGIGSEQP